LPARVRDQNQQNSWREDHRADILLYWRDHRGDYDRWYDDDWWNYYHADYPYTPDFNYWALTPWPTMSTWVDNGWKNPIYYNYGENVYYQNGSVYYGDQPVATEQEYAKQAEAIATNVPTAKPNEKDWMPLGVFAMTTDGEPTGAEPTMFLQLAVSRQGIINGSFQNTATKSVQPVAGMVDKQTQRAAWTAAGKLRPLMETGIVNLTKDTAAALIHFPDDTTQQCLLVRVNKPDSTDALKSKE
jgi:hypothetical protein